MKKLFYLLLFSGTLVACDGCDNDDDVSTSTNSYDQECFQECKSEHQVEWDAAYQSELTLCIQTTPVLSATDADEDSDEYKAALASCKEQATNKANVSLFGTGGTCNSACDIPEEL